MSSPESYLGIDGLAFFPQNPEELWQSLDALHTMIMDNTSDYEQAVLLPILQRAMDEVEKAYPNAEFYF